MADNHGNKFIRCKAGPLDAILLPSPGSGLIAAQLQVKRGSVDEGDGEAGVASFTASMLKRGTAARTSAQIAFALESLGAMAGHGGGLDSGASSLQSAAPDFPAALEIFFDSVRNPSFDESEMEIERQATIAHLKRIEDDKFDFTYRHYIKQIFAGHGYGHPIEGDLDDVKAIDDEKCRAWHSKTYRPENMLFAAAGDFDPEAMRGWVERAAADWPAGPAPAPRASLKTGAPIQTSSMTLEKELEQGFIVLGFRTPEMGHPDYAALRLACAVLGEGFTGRLFSRLRDERSLAYAVGSMLMSHRLGGHMALFIGTQPDRLDEAREGLLSEAEQLRGVPPNPEDLERAREYVIGKFLMDHQRLGSRVGYLARWEDLGLGAEFDDQWVGMMRSVTAEQVAEAAHRWWIKPTVVVLQPKRK